MAANGNYRQINESLYVINSPFEFGEGIFVSSYLLACDQGAILIDGGIRETVPQVLEALDMIGVEPNSLQLILITHAHGDHVGVAHYFQSRYGTKIAAPRPGARLIRDHELMFRDFMQAYPSQFPVTAASRKMWFKLPGKPVEPDILLDPGALEFDCEPYQVEVHSTPGHSYDHVSLFDHTNGWLFTGDCICGTGPFSEPPGYRNVAQYQATLDFLSGVPFRALYSGHFEPMDRKAGTGLIQASLETVGAIDEIVIKTLKDESDPIALAQVGDSLAEGLGKDYMIQALFTAEAHLDRLIEAGRVNKYGSEGALYDLVA